MQIKNLIVLAILAIFVGCSTKVSVVTTNQNQLDEAVGILDDANVTISYNDSNDTVKILAENLNGVPLPLTLTGVRIGEMNLAQAKEMCSILGFTDLNNTNFLTILASTNREIKNDGGFSNYPHLKTSKYPVLHVMPALNNIFSAFFDFIPEISSYYFTAPTVTQKFYLHSLTCAGTTQAHFSNNNSFNKDDFLKGALEGQLATYMQSSNNVYQQSNFFLVKEAQEIWEKEENKSGGARIKSEINFLSAAKEGAAEICSRSGHNGLLFYSVKYATSKNTPEIIYRYDSANGLWVESTAPSAYKLNYKYIDEFRDVRHKLEVPSVFLDNIYCF